MELISFHKCRFVVLMIIICSEKEVSSSQSFVVSFQPEIQGSFAAETNTWIEFERPIFSTREFTVCHWLNIRIFAMNTAACTWAYCTAFKKDDKTNCTQMCLEGISGTAKRNMKVKAWTHPTAKGAQLFEAPFDIYHHRTWFHLCWSLSTISGASILYLNGKAMATNQIELTQKEWAFSGSDKDLMTSLIFGQEPDSFRGGFDKDQSYIGSLSEFNVWNYTLKDSIISEIAHCKKLLQGNIVSWKESDWILNSVSKTNSVEVSDFCIRKPEYFIFPEKVRYPEARKICEVHGGSLALPRSEDESKDILDVVFEHKKTCIGNKISPEDPAIWIGAKRFNFTWYEAGPSITFESIGSPLNYTKVSIDPGYKNTLCAYIQNDGSWMDIQGDFGCYFKSLCTVCEIIDQPVFTVKGLCDVSDVDWNFYLDIDERYQIKRYEGYKKTDIVFDINDKKWNIVAKQGYVSSFNASYSKDGVSTVSYPIGRHNWDMQDMLCQVKDSEFPLSISFCGYPSHFSCDSGHCVDMNKRCDEKMDCNDGSDEKHCHLIDIPSSYSRPDAPDSPVGNIPLTIDMQNRIISIDSIDTMNMIVTITMEVTLKWFDKRLVFSNPEISKTNLITKDQTEMIWTPLREIINENAIIGEVMYDNEFSVKVNATYPGKLTASDVIENRLFNGSSNNLFGTQRMKAKYNCMFEAKKFPFDEHNCSIIFRIDQRKDKRIVFVNNGEILYEGENVVGQFFIGYLATEVKNTNESTRNIITIHIIRLYANQITITFVPTLILWLFGYITLFIEPNEDGFSDRFMGAGTALLVIVTLLNAIHTDLPKTSYVKYIDIWFMWHVISVFLMIAYHMILNRLRSYFNTKDVNKWVMISQINGSMILVFPTINGIFYAIYFSLTL